MTSDSLSELGFDQNRVNGFSRSADDYTSGLDALARNGYQLREKFEPIITKMKALGITPPTLEDLNNITVSDFGGRGKELSNLLDAGSRLYRDKKWDEGVDKINKGIDIGAELSDEGIANKSFKEALKTRGGSYAGFGLAGAIGGAALDPRSRIRGAALGLASMLFINWLRRKAKYGKLVNY